MVEKIFEIRIANVSGMPPHVKNKVAEKVEKMDQEKRKNYKGYAKVVYVTASPPKIKSVEPIEGTSADYYKKEIKGVDFSIF